MTNSQAPQPAPEDGRRIALVYDGDGAGGYFAQLRIEGLRTEAEAQRAIDHLQRLFCGEEIHVN